MQSITTEYPKSGQEYLTKAIELLSAKHRGAVVLTTDPDGVHILLGSSPKNIALMLGVMLADLEKIFPADAEMIFADALMQKIEYKRSLGMLENMPVQGNG
jgi:hypothetical protein